RHAERQTGAHAQAIEPVAQPAHAERSATVVEEDLDRRRLVTVMALQEDLPTVLEIRAQRPPGRPPEEPDALLAALADDPDLAPPHVECAQLGRCQLADTEPRRIRRPD